MGRRSSRSKASTHSSMRPIGLIAVASVTVFLAGTYVLLIDAPTRSFVATYADYVPIEDPHAKLRGDSFVDDLSQDAFIGVSDYPLKVRDGLISSLRALGRRIEPFSDRALSCTSHKKLQGTECIFRETEKSHISDIIEDSGIFDSSDDYAPVLTTYPTMKPDRLSHAVSLMPPDKKQSLYQIDHHLYFATRFTNPENARFVFVARLSDSYAQSLIQDACRNDSAVSFALMIPGDGTLTTMCHSSSQLYLSKSTDILPFGLEFTYRNSPVTWHNKSNPFPVVQVLPVDPKRDGRAIPDSRTSLLVLFSILGIEFFLSITALLYACRLKKRMSENDKASIDPRRVLVNLHEATNEILALRTLNSMLRFSDSDQHNKKIHRSISANISNFVSFVDNLSISLSDGAEFRLRETDFDLYDFLSEILEIYRLQAENKGLDFISEIEVDHPSIWHGDPDSLRQVISNIVGNAIKYTEHGAIEVRAKINDIDETLVIEVDDTGQGIDPSDVERIFQPFIRGDNTDQAVSGLGVGLYVCKMIADAMDGSITCQHLPDGGTRFTFSGRLRSCALPLTSEPFKDLVAVIGAEQGDARTDLVQALRKVGMMVDAADDSFTLGAVCERAKYLWKRLDVVVISETLPAEGAIEALARLEALDAVKDAIVLFVGSASEIDDRSKVKTFRTLSIPSSSPTQDILRLISNSLSINKQITLSVPDNGESSQHNRRILLVEDNPINVALIKQFLDRKCWTVISVSSGEEALDQLEKSRFDVVLMDLRLPGMSGCETTIKIREMPGLEISAVIGITAHRIDDVLKECSAAGMVTVISKTTGLTKLPEAIENAFLMKSFKTIAAKPIPLVEKDEHHNSENLIPNFDLSRFLEFRQNLGDKEARSVVSELFNDLPDILVELRRNLSQGDLRSAYGLIHRNLPVLYSIGAFPLYDFLFEIEEICRNNETQRIVESIRLCDQAIGIVKPYRDTIELSGWLPIAAGGEGKKSLH